MQRIFSDGSPISWKVRAITSNASVESKSPGKTNHCLLTVDVAHSFLKSHSLNVQNLLTAHITLFFYRRYERIGGKLPGKRGLFHFHIKRYDLAVSIIRAG